MECVGRSVCEDSCACGHERAWRLCDRVLERVAPRLLTILAKISNLYHLLVKSIAVWPSNIKALNPCLQDVSFPPQFVWHCNPCKCTFELSSQRMKPHGSL